MSKIGKIKELTPIINLSYQIQQKEKNFYLSDRSTKSFDTSLECELYKTDFREMQPLEIFDEFSDSINKNCRNDISMEDWIRHLITELRRFSYKYQYDEDAQQSEFLNICMVLCLFYLQDYNEIPRYLNSSISNINVKKHMELVKEFIPLDFNGSFVKQQPKILIIVGAASKEYKEAYRQTINIKNYKYRRFVHSVRLSSTFNCHTDIFEYIKKENYTTVFFVGHGNDNEDFFELPTFSSPDPRVSASLMHEQLMKNEIKLDLLAVLSCAHDSFINLVEFSNRTILPTTSNNFLSEAVIKTFLHYFDRYLNIELAIEYSLYSTIFRFDESLTFNVYPKSAT